MLYSFIMDNFEKPSLRLRSIVNQLYVSGLTEAAIVSLTGLKKSTVYEWTHEERSKRNDTVKRLIESLNLEES